VKQGADSETLRWLIVLGLDYVRWTQLVLMLWAWGALVLVLVALSFVSFQEQSLPLLERLLEAWASVTSGTAGDADGTIELSLDDLIDYAVWAWLGLSLLASVVGSLLKDRLRLPFLTTLRGRISTAAVAAIAASLGFFLIYNLSTVPYGGTISDALPLFIGLPLLAWIVTTYALSVSWIVDRFIELVERGSKT
jgi:hypothetical protein